MTDNISKNKRYVLTAVSPIIISDEKPLLEGRDFVQTGDNLFIINLEKLFGYCSKNKELQSKLLSADTRYGFFMNKLGLKLPEFASYALKTNLTVKQFSPFLRSCRGLPEIPASSLKGSVRTALLWAVAHEEGKVREGYFLSNEGKRAIENLLSEVAACSKDEEVEITAHRLEGTLFTGFRRKPDAPDTVISHWEAANADLMRAFYMSDAKPLDANQLTKLYELKVLSLNHRGGFDWKREEEWDDAANSPKKPSELTEVIESIVPQSSFTLSVKIDTEFLLNSEKAKALGLYREPKLNAIKNWHLQSLLYASEVANEEMKFFANLGLKEIAYFYQDLVNAINDADERTTTYLRIGRGIGWGNISGRFLRGDNLNEVRRIVPSLRGRERMAFPKTRKILFDNGKPCLPTGWVKLELKE